MKTNRPRARSLLRVAWLPVLFLLSQCASQVACKRDPPPQELNPARLPQKEAVEGCLRELKEDPPLTSGLSCRTLHSQVCSALPTATNCGNGT